MKQEEELHADLEDEFSRWKEQEVQRPSSGDLPGCSWRTKGPVRLEEGARGMESLEGESGTAWTAGLGRVWEETGWIFFFCL